MGVKASDLQPARLLSWWVGTTLRKWERVVVGSVPTKRERGSGSECQPWAASVGLCIGGVDDKGLEGDIVEVIGKLHPPSHQATTRTRRDVQGKKCDEGQVLEDAGGKKVCYAAVASWRYNTWRRWWQNTFRW